MPSQCRLFANSRGASYYWYTIPNSLEYFRLYSMNQSDWSKARAIINGGYSPCERARTITCNVNCTQTAHMNSVDLWMSVWICLLCNEVFCRLLGQSSNQACHRERSDIVILHWSIYQWEIIQKQTTSCLAICLHQSVCLTPHDPSQPEIPRGPGISPSRGSACKFFLSVR